MVSSRSCAFALLNDLSFSFHARYDLNFSRADNEVDMRYMINLEYSIDLPINTMGRRVRTRLYFTSESHLHTMLNVLRFAQDRTSVLSEQGVNILNDTSELCYLTQILLRLFEDSRWELDDPRRFRVEILFSPGAEATPLHMHEQDRDSDPSRFDTAPLQMIGRDGLTCQELEDFFHAAIMEGDADEPETDNNTETLPAVPDDTMLANGAASASTGLSLVEKSTGKEAPVASSVEVPDVPEEIEKVAFLEESKESPEQDAKDVTDSDSKEQEKTKEALPSDHNQSKPAPIAEKSDDDESGDTKDDEGDDSTVIRNLERKYFWTTVAVGSFMLAASCLVLALNLSSDSRRGARKYSTRRF